MVNKIKNFFVEEKVEEQSTLKKGNNSIWLPLSLIILAIAIVVFALVFRWGGGLFTKVDSTEGTGAAITQNGQKVELPAQNCRDIQVSYEEQEPYDIQQPYLDQELYERIVYDSTLNGKKVFAFFTISRGSKIKGYLETSKKSYFGITTPEECDNISHDRSFQPGYIVQNDITYYSFDKDTSYWQGNPTNLCVHVWDSTNDFSSENRVNIKITEYGKNDVTKYRTETRYKTVTKYKTEQRCN